MTKTPIHLWIVGVIALLWNAGGAYDYIMTQTNNAAYLEVLTEPQLAYMQNAPTWFEAAWAVGVWFAVLGAILILLRSRFAGSAFAISLLGLIVSAIYAYGLSDPSAIDVIGAFSVYFSIAIALSLIVLWVYARAMTKRGVLR